MKKALLSILFSITMILALAEPFSIYAAGDTFDSVNYQLVDYVSPNGSGAYINTGYNPRSNTTIVSTFSYTAVTSGRRFYGANDATNQYGLGISSSNYYVIRYSNGSNTINTNGKFVANTIIKFNQTPNVTTATDGSITYTTNTYSQSNNVNRGLTIFAVNTSGGVVNQYPTARLYEMEIYEGSTIIHHYYPCYRKSDNVVGVYDSVDSVFITATGGTLSYGSAVSSNYTITTSVFPSGSGSVTGGGSYASGSNVTLTATPSSGYVFTEWNDGNTSNPRTITVTQSESYTAYFGLESTPIPTYTISTSVSPSGSGSVSGGGSYSSGVTAVLTASPSSGFVFVRWSDNSVENPRSIVVSDNISLTAYFEEESVNPDPVPPSGWVDWTDSNDREYLDEINDIDLTKIYWSLYKSTAIDYFNIYQYRIDVTTQYTGDMAAYFTGTFSNGEFLALQSCTETSYTDSTNITGPTEEITVNPHILVDLNIPGVDLNYGINVTDTTTSGTTGQYSSRTNTYQACSLMGWNKDDGQMDVTGLLELGYTPKTVNYGEDYEATVYLPPDSNLTFEADMEVIDNILEGIYLQVTNNSVFHYHDEYSIQLHGKDGYLLPEYGSLYSKAFIGNIFDWNTSSLFLFDSLDDIFQLIPSNNTFASFNSQFSRVLSNNAYDKNFFNLYWNETRTPEWHFKTEEKTQTYTGFTQWLTPSRVTDSYGSTFGIGDSLTISSEQAAEFNLVAGSLVYLQPSEIKFYRYNNNSILNRFNQLGSFLQSWFTRIYNSIGNITGGNESNEIINNVVTDYDIDVETNFNGLLTNVKDKEQQIDLTLPEYNIPQSDLNGINSLAGSFKGLYQEVFIDNGLGILVLIPILLLVLRLIL